MIMANDANCLALAELYMGAAKDNLVDVLFSVILGTGVGGGIIVRENVIHGKHNIGGEWGHNYLDDSGGKCYCGNIGCVETIISGPALENYYYKLSNKKLSLATIYSNYLSGEDKSAVQVINRMVHFFAKSIATVINIIDPDIIVLAGGVSNIPIFYQQETIKKINNYVFNPFFDTPIVPSSLGDSAGVFGAALLVC